MMTVQVPHYAQGFLAAVYGNWQTPAPKINYCYGPLNTELEHFSSVENGSSAMSFKAESVRPA